ncbi:response regulator [Pyruvatibacter sp.]|uniref:response regulator n=1 Tax=Pyruvatibacter sp. TaxID=1981328 RepID=UPI003264676B
MPGKDQKPRLGVLAGVGIVAVDDNANTRRLLKELLLAFGTRDLRFAGDGATALEMINAKTPDLILCDWHMEPMDGIAFLRHLRHKDSGGAARTPAIMLTAHTKPEVVKASMDAGANHFVAKPIVPANLLKRIQWVRADKRIFLLDGDHYVLRDPGDITPRGGATGNPAKTPSTPASKSPAPEPVAAAAIEDVDAEEVWEI